MIITEPLSSEKQEDSKLEKTVKPSLSKATSKLYETLQKEAPAEEKLKQALSFMKEAISQTGAARFKDFWDAKTLCLPLFKEKLPQPIKEIFWKEYTDLAHQAKRLKEMLEEQSSFACEQIELALKTLSLDVEQVLSRDKEENNLQQDQEEITSLMNHTTRLKALREEVIKTEMRVRDKNRLFKEIGQLGDRFIPRKNALIKKVSQQFYEDVSEFCKASFDMKQKKLLSQNLKTFELKEKIKAFQELAKHLTLQTAIFNATRVLLTNGWDIVKEEEKERKKLFLEKKEQESKEIENIKALIDSQFSLDLSSQDLIEKTKERLLEKIETLSLRAVEKKELKHALFKKVEEKLFPFKEAAIQREEARKKEDEEKKRKRQEAQENLKNLVLNEHTLDELENEHAVFFGLMNEGPLTSEEKGECEEILAISYENILQKKEILAKEDQEKLFAVRKLWVELKEQTKQKLELYRKQISLSGFDFQKAILFNEAIKLEKQRLERCLQKIEKLEEILD